MIDFLWAIIRLDADARDLAAGTDKFFMPGQQRMRRGAAFGRDWQREFLRTDKGGLARERTSGTAWHAILYLTMRRNYEKNYNF